MSVHEIVASICTQLAGLWSQVPFVGDQLASAFGGVCTDIIALLTQLGL